MTEIDLQNEEEMNLKYPNRKAYTPTEEDKQAILGLSKLYPEMDYGMGEIIYMWWKNNKDLAEDMMKTGKKPCEYPELERFIRKDNKPKYQGKDCIKDDDGIYKIKSCEILEDDEKILRVGNENLIEGVKGEKNIIEEE